MYFNLDNQQMIKEEKENISKDKAVNPRFSGRHHSEKSKQAISQSQTRRYDTIKDYLKQGLQRLTEEDVKRICKQTLDEYISKHTTPVKGNNNLIIPL